MSHAVDFTSWRSRLVSLTGSALVTAVLFVLVVPLSHWLAKDPVAPPPRTISTVTLPPPPPPPLTTEQEVVQEIAEVTASAPRPLGAPIELQALPTQTLQLSGVTTGVLDIEQFPLQMSGPAEALVFDVVDLDRVPQLISNPARVMPYDLLRDEIRGQVRLKILISPKGHVSVLEVLSTDHERLITPARRFAEKCRFEPPMRNNQPVATAYIFPISF
ncbi:TonB family protein [Cerasicoccus arenae]|uniref:TonB C-terminal domain-containing protein n=1 Tax=Cerasicoccus arenae TaxID=424488 RepID=A0A8J3GEJ5_9BACT|nr:TonB family protein [Cerasicoccus arenae]MBK1856739.1 TonB family protein [Cerasicoccus arenae]GHB99210.1 hypothetical protein GCM10007047_14210 [Cerasicoccus arenae]